MNFKKVKMKKLTIVFLVALMTSVSAFSNNSDNIKEIDLKLRKKIVELLGNYKGKLDSNLETSIEFLINKKGEIVVLSIDSKKDNVASFIKNKLNYKIASVENLEILKRYRVPVKFVKTI
tara:strand:- start:8369 stop:8728 length:360 start_codon:yes stop_codon:yes gene_type:complete